jgi:hypothetical protein
MIDWFVGKLFGLVEYKNESAIRYVQMFDEFELKYMSDVEIMSFIHEPVEFVSVESLGYIRTEIAIKTGKVSSKEGMFRSLLRAELRKIVRQTRGKSFRDVMKIIEPLHFGSQVEFEDEERLGFHLTMLRRICLHADLAPFLPELDAYNEGVILEPVWRSTKGNSVN